jgi:hypothetical protein
MRHAPWRAGRLRWTRASVASVALALAWGSVLEAAELLTWRLEGGAVRTDAGAPDRPLPVGSLAKPFVAKAWAKAHPTARPPVERCDAASHCWRPAGHGRLGLAHAVSVSCNVYFKKMAADTPLEVLKATLEAEGFLVPSPLSPETAIGLADSDGALAARPEALLRAYARLVATPWDTGESVRREVLAGLRESALDGTARGLGHRGFWAKTGTVPALDGRPLATSGLVVAVDDSGWAVLGLLRSGTGREAAAALALPLGGLRPWSSPREAAAPANPRGARPAGGPAVPVADDRVRVGLLEILQPRAVTARNLGPAPAGSARGFVGPGASVSLGAGDRLSEALWELSLPGRRFLRRLRASLEVEAGPRDTLRLRAEVRTDEYVAGVMAAELPEGEPLRRADLGAAVLRFLAAGPRHGTYDVCDDTHCAWFIGRGPRLLWTNPRTPVLLARGRAEEELPPLEGATWERIRAAARQEGPSLWTGHCGGAPLSAHFVWGNGDRRVFRCDRHPEGDAAAWSRLWSATDVARAFGADVEEIEIRPEDGVWTLHARTVRGELHLRYDEAHRRLAAILGWDALPSPADRVVRAPGGFRASGCGRGHRVGLCLGD